MINRCTQTIRRNKLKGPSLQPHFWAYIFFLSCLLFYMFLVYNSNEEFSLSLFVFMGAHKKRLQIFCLRGFGTDSKMFLYIFIMNYLGLWKQGNPKRSWRIYFTIVPVSSSYLFRLLFEKRSHSKHYHYYYYKCRCLPPCGPKFDVYWWSFVKLMSSRLISDVLLVS